MEDVTTKNRLIAEFMGGTVCNDEREGIWVARLPNVPHPMNIEYMEYHSSFYWLMPAVEKIEQFLMRSSESEFKIDWVAGASIYSFKHGINVRFHYHPEVEGSKIDAVWKTVLGFIQWYNTQHPQSKQTV